MNCNRIHTLLNDYIDGDISEKQRAEVEGHLAACDNCQKEFESLRRTVALVRDLPQVPAPVDVTETICAAVKREAGMAHARRTTLPRSRRKSYPLAIVLNGVALAACAVLAITIVFHQEPTGHTLPVHYHLDFEGNAVNYDKTRPERREEADISRKEAVRDPKTDQHPGAAPVAESGAEKHELQDLSARMAGEAGIKATAEVSAIDVVSRKTALKEPSIATTDTKIEWMAGGSEKEIYAPKDHSPKENTLRKSSEAIRPSLERSQIPSKGDRLDHTVSDDDVAFRARTARETEKRTQANVLLKSTSSPESRPLYSAIAGKARPTEALGYRRQFSVDVLADEELDIVEKFKAACRELELQVFVNKASAEVLLDERDAFRDADAAHDFIQLTAMGKEQQITALTKLIQKGNFGTLVIDEKQYSVLSKFEEKDKAEISSSLSKTAASPEFVLNLILIPQASIVPKDATEEK